MEWLLGISVVLNIVLALLAGLFMVLKIGADEVELAKQKANEAFYRNIKEGDVFTFNEFEKGNPFKNATNATHKVIVKDVKNGFVNYAFADSSFYQDESMDVVAFNSCYVPDA